MKKLLEGVRVLDLTRVLAGPYASMILADLGAEIIKVELPGKGDEARDFGPFLNGESAYFMSINRGKKSVAIDLHNSRGRELAQQLASRCDVFIENFRPGSMERFGLDYGTLRSLCPRLVYVSISGFGQTGPYARLPAYDVVIQAMGGIASITGNPESPPVRVGSSIADLNAALFGNIGLLAALIHARETGKGQHLDISMLDCQVALLENAIARYFVTGEVPGPLGSRHPAITPFQFFKAQDGYIVIAAGNDKLWGRLCETLERPELISDPRFQGNAKRTENHADLEVLLSRSLEEKTVAEWTDLLAAAGVPCGPIHNVEQLVSDPQVQDRRMIVELAHPLAGELAMPNSPLKFSSTPVELNLPAPVLGQHTDEVLQSLLDLSAEDLEDLHREGVTGHGTS